MKTTSLIYFLQLITALPTAQSFAYAPNFITKIIQESSGIAPVGLADVASSSSSNNITDVSEDNIVQEPTSRQIITRFPPEPNGYLHLGHAKAVSFNFAVARSFHGKCHMRLDDTNPSKEDEEYVRSILDDVRWIQSGLEPFDSNENEVGDNSDKKEEEYGPWYGNVKKTSDYFELIHDAAIMLIQNGEAYVDELTAEEMREYRGTLTEGGKESPWRERGIDENLRLFREMREGQHPEGKYVLRAKIDMSSPNLNLRDPVLYRIKHESHQATADTWCIYPMYDFSHPIADAIEGISHSLCTLEFEDHRPLYDWVVERIVEGGLVDCRPRQIEFSRLNLKYTVLSKRKLIKLVEEKHVTGWDDPRMPTLSGIRRRGVPPAAVRLFCERMGISKSDSNIDFGIMEDCTREVLDDVSPRAFAILEPLKVTIQNWDDGHDNDNELETFDVPRHPKREDLGDRAVLFGKSVYIERSDFFDVEGPEGAANGHKAPKGFKRLLPNDKVRLKYAYVIRCDEVVRDSTTNEPVELKCTYYPETRAGVTPEGEKRVAGIIQWVEASTAKKCTVMQYDRLFKTEEPGKETGDFIDDINPDSLKVMNSVVVEPSVAADALELLQQIVDGSSSSGETIDHSSLTYQFERSGYYALDTSSTNDILVFNRVVTLRDTWAPNAKARQEKQQKKAESKPKQQDNEVLEDARRIALRVGTIVEAGPHPEADSLIVCKLDCGDKDESGEAAEPRTVVAGLAGKIPFDKLIGRKIVCISNLKPAKMRGIESTAMLLAASDGREGDDEIVELLDVPDSVPNGELVYFENMLPCKPDAMLKSKGALKVWDRVKAALKVGVDKEAIYQDDGADRRLMTSAGPVTVSSLSDCMIG